MPVLRHTDVVATLARERDLTIGSAADAEVIAVV
jgi:hypothetical protein